MATAPDQSLSTVQQKCPNHKQRDIDYFCNDCKVALCSKCIYKQHKDHETLDLECAETRQKTVEKVQHSQTIIQKKIKELEKVHTTLLETYKLLEFSCEDACAKITEKNKKKVSDFWKSCEKDLRENLAENKLKVEKTEKEVKQQIDKLKTQSNIPSETSTLNILQSFPQIEELEKLCQSLKVQLPKIQFKKWQENIMTLGRVVAGVYYIPSMYQFRLDINDIKDVGIFYYNKDKLHQYDITWSCGVEKCSDGYLTIMIRVLLEDNPDLEYCDVNYNLSLLNTVNDKKTLTRTFSNTFINGYGLGWCYLLTWSEFTDKNNGYLTSNGQFVVQLDITQIREISFK